MISLAQRFWLMLHVLSRRCLGVAVPWECLITCLYFKFGLSTRVSFAENTREYVAMPDIFFLCFGGMSCTEENSGADWKARSEWLEWQLASPVTTHVVYPQKEVTFRGRACVGWGQ